MCLVSGFFCFYFWIFLVFESRFFVKEGIFNFVVVLDEIFLWIKNINLLFFFVNFFSYLVL